MHWLLLAGSVLLIPLSPTWAKEKSFDCVIEPKSSVKLGSPEKGILVELLVQRGDRIHKGQALAKLDMGVEKHTAELARIRAESDVELRSGQTQVEFRGKDVERLKSLTEQSGVAVKDYDKAIVEQKLAEYSLEASTMEHQQAQVENERAQALLERRTIRSPLNGVVVDINMSPGEYVHEQTTLMDLAQVNPLYVEVFVPVSEFGNIKKGMKSKVRPEKPVGGVYEAKVIVVDRVFDPASRTFGVRLKLPNPKYELPAGLRCSVSFSGS